MPAMVVKSASRAISILELFSHARAPLRLNDIWPCLGYPQSSTTALLKSLVSDGYLNYDRVGRTYFPTMRVGRLGDWISTHIFQDGKLLDMLGNLSHEIGETVVLVAQNDLHAHYIHTLESTREQASHVVPGARRLLPRSSAGLALLSQMADGPAERLCRSINVREPDRANRIDLVAVGEDIARVRQLGYAVLHGTRTLDFATATISISLPAARHGVPLAVSICGPDYRVMPQRQSIVAKLRSSVSDLNALPA